MKRIIDNDVIQKANALQDAENVYKETKCFVEKLTRSLDNQQLVEDQKVTEICTELNYEERSVSRKMKNKTCTWTFESGKNVPSWLIVFLMQNN